MEQSLEKVRLRLQPMPVAWRAQHHHRESEHGQLRYQGRSSCTYCRRVRHQKNRRGASACSTYVCYPRRPARWQEGYPCRVWHLQHRKSEGSPGSKSTNKGNHANSCANRGPIQAGQGDARRGQPLIRIMGGCEGYEFRTSRPPHPSGLWWFDARSRRAPEKAPPSDGLCLDAHRVTALKGRGSLRADSSMGEHRLYTPRVAGSSPVPPTRHTQFYWGGS